MRCGFACKLPLLVCLLTVTSSCQPAGPKLYPVKGTVLYQNLPAEGAHVVFYPSGDGLDSYRPSGTVGPDGTFTLNTYPHGAGAPAGGYTVLVTWLPANAREVDNPKNKLPDRYGDVSKSGLRATVDLGPTELAPFKLTK